jgi:hypothetical protein
MLLPLLLGCWKNDNLITCYPLLSALIQVSSLLPSSIAKFVCVLEITICNTEARSLI